MASESKWLQKHDESRHCPHYYFWGKVFWLRNEHRGVNICVPSSDETLQKTQTFCRSQGEILIIILCLLLSGDVHQCPGPISDSGGDMNKGTGSGEATDDYHAGVHAAEDSGKLHLDLPIQPETNGVFAGWSGNIAVHAHAVESSLREDRGSDGATSGQPSHESIQRGHRGRATGRHERGAAESTQQRKDVPELISSSHKSRVNPQSKPLQRRYDLTLFKTLNHAKVIWDAKSKPKRLLGAHLNVWDISSKTDQVEKMLTDSNLDFICISETLLKKTSPRSAFYIPGFSIFRRGRNTGKRGGGLLFYVKDNLKCSQINVQDKLEVETECIALTINLSPQMSFIVIGVYRPPGADASFYASFKEILRDLSALGKEVIVLGDLNVN